MEPVIIAQVKEHLAQGDFENALKLLETYAASNLDSKKASKVKNEIIYLQGQINEVKKAESRGLIAFEQAERNRNQIRLSMIGLTDAVAGDDDAHPVFSEDRPQGLGVQPGSNTNIYKYIVVGIAAIVLFVLAISMCEDDPAESNDAAGNELITTPDNSSGDMATQHCSLETLEEVELLDDADINAAVIGMLPANTEYEVLQIKTQSSADGDAEFMQVESATGKGWVEYYPDQIRLSPGCN